MSQEQNAIALMGEIDGWFSAAEAGALYRAATDAIRKVRDGAVVEIGSYKGRSTVILAAAVRDAGPGLSVHAIDPHEGILTDRTVQPTWETFNKNMEAAGISTFVEPVRKRSQEVTWDGKISVLFIDGLHDEDSVSEDFRRFGRFVAAGGVIAFHDYGNPDYPGVRHFVDHMIALGEVLPLRMPTGKDPYDTLAITRRRARLSIIVPTCGRKRLNEALASIAGNGILDMDDVIVVGDGPQPVAREIVSNFSGLLPIRYFEYGPTRMVGASQRNYAITKAFGTHLAFIDDDDEYTKGAINVIRMAAEEHPGRVLVFKEKSCVERHTWGVVWRTKEIKSGNVGTQGIVIPNAPGRIGLWPEHYCADYDFLRSTVDLYPDRDSGVVWIDHIVACLY